MEKNEKTGVVLTIGRHSEHDRRTEEITESGRERGETMGWRLKEKHGEIDYIYTSGEPRSDATGLAIAKGAGVPKDNIIVNDCIDENVWQKDFFGFIKEVIEFAKEKNAKHIHLQTHLPTFVKLGYQNTEMFHNNCFIAFEAET